MASCFATSIPAFLQDFHFIQQRRRIDHHAVPDHSLDSRPQYAARNQLQNEFLLADEHRMAGIVTALIARHDGEFLGEKVNHLPLAFVAPLRAQYNDVAHGFTQNASLYREWIVRYCLRQRSLTVAVPKERPCLNALQPNRPPPTAPMLRWPFMQLSAIFLGLGEQSFTALLRAISIGKLKTFQLYDRMKARLHLAKLNSENIRKAEPRFWARIARERR